MHATIVNLCYDKYFHELCLFVYKIVNDHDTADDIVQEVFCKLIEHEVELDIEKNIKSYLYSSSRNAAFSYLKREMRIINLYPEIHNSMKHIHECMQVSRCNDEMRVYNSAGNAIREAVERLTPEENEIIYLRYYKDKKVSTIARVTNSNRYQVTKTLEDAHVKIKHELKIRKLIKIESKGRSTFYGR